MVGAAVGALTTVALEELGVGQRRTHIKQIGLAAAIDSEYRMDV